MGKVLHFMRKHKGLFRYQGIIPIFLTFALTLALAGCTKDVPHPTIAKPGNEIEMDLMLPDTVALPAETVGTVYQSMVDTEASLERAAALLGISRSDLQRKASAGDTEKYATYAFPGGELTLEQDTGYIMYNADFTGMAAYDESEFPSDDAVETMTRERLKTVLPEQADTVQIEISRSTGWDGERDGVKYKTAHVHPTMDGKAVYGVYRIRLSFDRDGNVVELYLLYNPVEAKMDVPLKNAQKLQETLSAGDYAASVDQELQSYSLTSAGLAYYMDADVNEAGDFFMYPVYVLKGTGSNQAGETQTFDVIVDAVQ